MPRPAHIHLQPLGGIAGDMFMSAMVAGWPELADLIRREVTAAGVPGAEKMAFVPVKRKGLAALWLDFDTAAGDSKKPPHHYRDIRQNLHQAPLAAETKEAALAILALIAEAEAEIHGIAIDAVHFHEVADWDSLADVVAAGAIAGYFAGTTWSSAALPLGGGQVDTAHGRLPVPAPATQVLMTGLEVFDDGILGERVTPTGAAIVKYLLLHRGAPLRGGIVDASGFGAGSRDMPAIANVLRVAGYRHAARGQVAYDQVAVIECDIDDMTPEELAAAGDALRAVKQVLDVAVFQGIGKKGRALFQLRALVHPQAGEQVADWVLRNTTTLGVRLRVDQRRVLARELVRTPSGVQVKRTDRGTGLLTAKAEADDLAASVYPRRAQARQAEDDALTGNAESAEND